MRTGGSEAGWTCGGCQAVPTLPIHPPLTCTLTSLVILPAPQESLPGPTGSPAIRSLEAQSLRCLQPFSTQDTWGQPFHARAQEALDVLLRHPSGGPGRSLGTRPSAPWDVSGPQEPKHPLPLSWAQAGGWWRMRTSRRHGFLLPTWKRWPWARDEMGNGP